MRVQMHKRQSCEMFFNWLIFCPYYDILFLFIAFAIQARWGYEVSDTVRRPGGEQRVQLQLRMMKQTKRVEAECDTE